MTVRGPWVDLGSRSIIALLVKTQCRGANRRYLSHSIPRMGARGLGAEYIPSLRLGPKWLRHVGMEANLDAS